MTEEEQRRVDYIKRRIWNQKDNQRIKVDGPHKDWLDLCIDYILDLEDKRIARKKKMLEREEALKNGFQGNPLDPEDVLEYEKLIDGKIVSSYEEADGTCVQVYEDGNVVRICYTLTSIFPDMETQDKCLKFLEEKRMDEKVQRQKEALSSYLGIPSFEVSTLDWCAIDDLVLERSRKDGPIKQLKYRWIEKVGRKNV